MAIKGQTFMQEKPSNDLTQGNLLKKIFFFSLPLIFSNLLQVLFNMSDIAIVGKFGSANALGSVGSTSMYVMMFTGFLIGLGNGVNALIAKRIGLGDKDAIVKSSHTSLIICFIIGLILMVLGIILAKPILILLHTKDELLDGALKYVYIYFLGLPAASVYNYGNGTLSADGETKKPFIILLFSGILNICLNLFFVIVLKLTVEGVAFASIISLYVSAISILIILRKVNKPYSIYFKKLKIYSHEAKTLLKLGIPAGFQNAIFSIANMFIQSGVNSLSTIVVNGNSAAMNADNIVYDIMAAFYTACASFISQNYGKGKKENILKCYYISLMYAVLFGLVLGIILLIFGKTFLSLFTSEEEVINAGMSRMKILCLAYFLSGFMDGAISASRGLGKTIIPTIIVIMGSCIFRIIWVYTIFAYFKTSTSLYLLYSFSFSLTAIVENIYFIKIYKNIMHQK